MMPSTTRWARALTLLALAALGGCGDERSAAGTGLYVVVRFSGLPPIHQLELAARAGEEAVLEPIVRPDPPRAEGLESGESFRIRLNDALAGREVVVSVRALSEGVAVAEGTSAPATVSRGREVDVEVLLSATAELKLVFGTAPQTVRAGECSPQPVVLNTADLQDRSTPVDSDLQVGLVASSAQFFRDGQCREQISNVTIAAGATSGTFFFSGTQAGKLLIVAAPISTKVAQATQEQTVIAGPARRLGFVDPVAPLAAGECGQVLLRPEDEFGNPASFDATVTGTLGTSSPTMTFHADSWCVEAAITTVRVAPTSSEGTVYYRDNRAGTPLMSVGGEELLRSEKTVTIEPRDPVRLEFVGSPIGKADAPISGLEVAAVDQFGNASTQAAVDVTLALEEDPTGSAVLGGTLTVAASQGVATFADVRLTAMGDGFTLRATAPSLQAAVSSPFKVSAGDPAKLQFLTQPAGGAAGSPLPGFEVQVVDLHGNPAGSNETVTLVAVGPGAISGGGSAVASGGVARFDSVVLRTAGGYTLRAGSGSLASATSDAFVVRPGPASKLVFETGPASTTAGTPFNPTVEVEVRDALDNVVMAWSASVSLTLTGGSGGKLSGTTTANTVDGVARFPGLSVLTAGSAYKLRATSAQLSVDSASFNIAVGAPAKLAFKVQPSGVVAGTPVSPAVQVAVQDASGNEVTSAPPTSISLSLAAGSGTLSGNSATTVNGVASFPSLAIAQSGTGFQLRAQGAGFTADSVTFNVAQAGSNRLVFVSVLPSAVAGDALPSFSVEVKDANNNTVSVNGTVTLGFQTNPGGGTLSVTSAALTNGVATFTGVRIDKTGVGYQLKATTGVPNVTEGVSNSFEITPGPAAKLAFTQGPTSTTAGAPFNPPVKVAILDWYDNLVPTASHAVSLTLSPSSGVLRGTTTISASGGVATFSDLYVERAGTGYYLNATATGPNGTSSAAFSISVGPPSRLRFTSPASTVEAGTCTAATIGIEDAHGNPSPRATATSVSLASSSGSGKFYGGQGCQMQISSFNLGAGATSGTVYWRDTLAGSPTLTAAASGLDPATQVQTVQPGPPTKLAFLSPSRTVQAGTCIGATVESRDAFDNPSPVLAATPLTFTSTPSDVSFHQGVPCNTVLTQGTLGAGSRTFAFMWKGRTAGTVSLSVSSPGFAPANQAQVVTPAPAARLAISGTGHQVVAGACSPLVAVHSVDPFGNLSPVSHEVTVRPSFGNGGAWAVHRDPACQLPPISSISIPASGHTASPLYFTHQTAGQRNLVVDDAVQYLASGSQVQQIAPGPPTQVAFATPPQALLHSQCSCPAVIRSTDQFGNPSPVSTELTVGLSASTGAIISFHLNLCSAAPVFSVKIPAGSSAASFLFSDLTVSAPDPHLPYLNATPPPGLAGAQQQQMVVQRGIDPPTRTDCGTSPMPINDLCLPDGGSCTPALDGGHCCFGWVVGAAYCHLEGVTCSRDSDCCSGRCCGGLCQPIVLPDQNDCGVHTL